MSTCPSGRACQGLCNRNSRQATAWFPVKHRIRRACDAKRVGVSLLGVHQRREQVPSMEWTGAGATPLVTLLVSSVSRET